jgi:hypothetical protein
MLMETILPSMVLRAEIFICVPLKELFSKCAAESGRFN